MFTGLVEDRGIVSSVRSDGAAIQLDLEVPAALAEGCAIGDSVSINGCCLTVIEIAEPSRLAFQAGAETLAKTNLGQLEPGGIVNLERSLPVNGRLGGHFVQGHVDTVGHVDAIERDGEWVTMWFRLPKPFLRQIVRKGSIAVDGISLTVVETDSGRFSVALIPHTLNVTTLGSRVVGAAVNIETDILGKYVEQMLAARQGTQ